MFLIALASALTAPVPTNVTSWFTGNDVPDYLLRVGTGAWSVPVRINVSPDGTLRSCEVEASSRIPGLDKLTCALLRKRAKFRPARAVDGFPVYGVYRTPVIWVIADEPWDTSKASSPDLDVFVERMPKGVESPALVRVMFAVAASGKKTSCVVDQGKGLQVTSDHPALAPIACEKILSDYQAKPATDDTGAPIPSIQNAVVRFSVPEVKRKKR